MSKTLAASKAQAVGVLLVMTMIGTAPAQAGVSVSPYVSVKSTKSIKPDAKDKSKENETIKQRQEYGMRGAISFWRLFKLQASMGQSTLTTTEKTQDAKDEYGEIDYQRDMDISTEDPGELKITETQQNAKLSVILDPGFWIFILRAKAGVTAKQRKVDIEQTTPDDMGALITTKTSKMFGPTYKPHSGLGAGIRLGRMAHFMIEYNFEHYKFPEIEPFEREVAVSFGLQL